MENSKPSIKFLTTNQAAAVIGCSPQQVRVLVRQGKLKHRRKKSAKNPVGYDLEIEQPSAKAYSKTIPKRGWPRGQKRK